MKDKELQQELSAIRELMEKSTRFLSLSGLSLINAGQYSFPVVRNLGFWEIGFGLIAALFPEQGLLCWITGFGFLHIRYGLLIHLKLNR